MAKLADKIRRHRGELVVDLLRAITYLGVFLIFYGFMSIHNWQLLHINRTTATTLLTWLAVFFAMHLTYGGYDVGRKKSRPIISSMTLGCIFTDAVTYLQLEIMNVNSSKNAALQLFGEDLLPLFAAVIVQFLFIYGMVRLGNFTYFRVHRPRRCLLILGDMSQKKNLIAKIGRYRLQWHVSDVVLWNDSDLRARIENAEVVFMAEVPEDRRMTLLRICYDLHRDVVCKADLQEIMLSTASSIVVDDALFMEMDYHKVTIMQRVIKRTMDIVISALVLLITWPLLLLVALCIYLEDHGPVIFSQERMTVHGHRFTIRKFRTMRVDASKRDIQKSAIVHDDRITRVGKILRRTRLDEFPQFWNILIGDMTLVGPRPEMLANVEKYKIAVPTFIYREKMKAGLTGYAQIEGRYNTAPEDKLMMDLMYIENFSIWNDIRLLFRTFTVPFKKDSTSGFQDKT